MSRLDELRSTYASFFYQEAKWELTDRGLQLQFIYSIEPDFTFQPTLTIVGVTQDHLDHMPDSELDAWVFHIGLAELFSYWKLTASPEISIAAGSLTDSQLDWWRTLLIKGMGEYFYVNTIDFTQHDFVTISSERQPRTQSVGELNEHQKPISSKRTNKILIPIGGGKDSIVSLELFKQLMSETNTIADLGSLLIAPTQAASEVATISGLDQIIVERQLDPLLFELNDQDFLNGHVPVSALFAFVSVFIGRLFGYTHVAISNERSSNEGNVQYLRKDINHQYSKTYEFERSFQSYTAEYLPTAPLYFSMMRPLYELQIGQRFSKMEAVQKYFSAFRSCNRGQKTNTWCGECSKCLFAYSILYPFMDSADLKQIFGSDLWQKAELYPISLALLGRDKAKPFECVGTQEETICAFYLCVEKARGQGKLPPLLARVDTEILSQENNLDARSQAVLQSWNNQHSIPNGWDKILK